MTLLFETESGSTYEIRDLNPAERYLRRANPEAGKRADGDWVRLYSVIPIGGPYVGRRAHLTLDPLAEYGADDEGNQDTTTAYTIRTTTPVTKIWTEGETA